MLIKYKQLEHLVGILDWVNGLLEVLEREAYKDNKTQAVAAMSLRKEEIALARKDILELQPKKKRFYERFRRQNGGGE